MRGLATLKLCLLTEYIVHLTTGFHTFCTFDTFTDHGWQKLVAMRYTRVVTLVHRHKCCIAQTATVPRRRNLHIVRGEKCKQKSNVRSINRVCVMRIHQIATSTVKTTSRRTDGATRDYHLSEMLHWLSICGIHYCRPKDHKSCTFLVRQKWAEHTVSHAIPHSFGTLKFTRALYHHTRNTQHFARLSPVTLYMNTEFVISEFSSNSSTSRRESY